MVLKMQNFIQILYIRIKWKFNFVDGENLPNFDIINNNGFRDYILYGKNINRKSTQCCQRLKKC